MSEDWHIYCVTCNEEHSQHGPDTNHQDALMLDIIRGRTAIEAMANVPSVDLSTYYGPIYPEWFVRHRGHELVARSEYGNIKRIACMSKHPIWGNRCECSDGHEGPHQASVPHRLVRWSDPTTVISI